MPATRAIFMAKYMCVCVYTSVCISIHTCIYIQVCMGVCLCLCLCTQVTGLGGSVRDIHHPDPFITRL